MRRFSRSVIIIYSFLIALMSVSLLLQVLNVNWGTYFISILYSIADSAARRSAAIVMLLLLLACSVGTLVYAIVTTRLSRTRVSSNEVGAIDIGVDAIESIALNASKAAQAGVKNAKARVAQGKGGSLRIIMIVQLYSDVEIPAQMAKIQDRVKKDVERFTGIAVSDVRIKVKQVELIGAKVER